MAQNDDESLIVNSVKAEDGSRVVIGRDIHIHSEARIPITPLDPFATIPPLPGNFINRPELSEPLVDSLISNSATVGLTALEGMGGIGKTIAALGLCHDHRIRQAFPDGIVWLTIGKEADVLLAHRMERIARALNLEFRNYSEDSYRSMLRDKAALIVLDDVWTLDAIEPFRLPTGRSRLLYTTRNRNLAAPLGADSHEIGVLHDAQARNFLLRWSGRERQIPPEPYATEILAECKGLVLGLAMIGSALRGQPDSEWPLILTDLKKARLKEIGQRPGGYAYDTLHASIAVSVEALSPIAREKYLRLAVLLEDMSASNTLLQALWGGEYEEVHRITRLLVDRSLASRDAEDNIHLHDFQLDYVRGEYPDPDTLTLLRATVLRSLHVLRRCPEQFTSQMVGRLLFHTSNVKVAAFLKDLESHDRRPRIRPLWPALQSPGGPALRVLEGHTDYVAAVVLSADGRCAVSGSRDRTVRVWDLAGNQAPRLLEGHTDWVTAVDLSEDGRRVISGSRDRTVRVWDLEGSQGCRVLQEHNDWVTAVALSADGRRAISGSQHHIFVWDLDGEKSSRILKGHRRSVDAVTISEDGRWAISGSSDHTIRIWDLDGDEPPRVLEGHSDGVTAVALSQNGQWIASGSRDHTVRIWNLKGNQLHRSLEGHLDWVQAVAISADGRRAVSGSDDQTMRVWDLDGSRSSRVLEGHDGSVYTVALSLDGRRVISGSRDRTVRVWNLDGGERPLVSKGHNGSVQAVALAADGRCAVSGSDDHTIRRWDLHDNKSSRVFEGHNDSVNSVALSLDAQCAVSGSSDRTVRVWDLEGSRPSRVLEGHNGPVAAVALSVDGRWAISGSHDNTVRVWDLVGNQAPRVLEGHSDWVYGVALSVDGQYAVSGSGDNTIRVWHLGSSQPPRVLEGHSRSVSAVALSVDGQRVVSGSRDHTLRVWDLDGNQPSRVMEGHSDWVYAVALSADGRRVVSGSSDKTVRVWDLEKNQCLASFTCDAPVLCCSWAGSNIAAGDRNGKFHLFLWEE